jgi:hypothetical protein
MRTRRPNANTCKRLEAPQLGENCQGDLSKDLSPSFYRGETEAVQNGHGDMFSRSRRVNSGPSFCLLEQTREENATLTPPQKGKVSPNGLSH